MSIKYIPAGKAVLIMLGLAAYSGIATTYAIPEVKREVAHWGFNERLREAADARDDQEKAKHAGVAQDVFIAATGGQ